MELRATRRDGCFTTTGKLGQEIQYINVSLDVSELDYEESEAERTHTPVKHGRGGFGTYAEIKAYVLETFGMKVSSLYIGQIKDKVGIKERKNYNTGSGKAKVPKCPPEKENAIIAAFRHFNMI